MSPTQLRAAAGAAVRAEIRCIRHRHKTDRRRRGRPALPCVGDGGCTGLPVGDCANGRSTSAAAGGAFEAPVETLFLSSSRAVETPRQGSYALRFLRGEVSEEVGVQIPCAPYRVFRRPPSVGQVDGPALLQYLVEYLAGLTFFHGRAVPIAVLPLAVHWEYTFPNLTRSRAVKGNLVIHWR